MLCNLIHLINQTFFFLLVRCQLFSAVFVLLSPYFGLLFVFVLFVFLFFCFLLLLVCFILFFLYNFVCLFHINNEHTTVRNTV